MKKIFIVKYLFTTSLACVFGQFHLFTMYTNTPVQYYRRLVENVKMTEHSTSSNNKLLNIMIENFRDLLNERQNTTTASTGYLHENTSLRDNITMITFSGIGLSENIQHEEYTDSDEETDVATSTEPVTNTASSYNNGTEYTYSYDHERRSCIRCSNVNNEECNEPLNKIVPTMTCPNDDDVCFSLHTPYGIVDRGCFNAYKTHATYVCSRNLCNYISILEMPYIFTNKEDWIKNVVEITSYRNFRRLRKLHELECLRCEANVTKDTDASSQNVECIDATVGDTPSEKCEEDEICAIKVLRRDNYIWRGCVKSPLYNYWWSLCDADNCNYHKIISVYDFEEI